MMKTTHKLKIIVQEKVFHQGQALSLQGHTAWGYSRIKDGTTTRFILKHQSRVTVDHFSTRVDDQSFKYKEKLHKNNNRSSPHRLVVLPLLITVERRYQWCKNSYDSDPSRSKDPKGFAKLLIPNYPFVSLCRFDISFSLPWLIRFNLDCLVCMWFPAKGTIVNFALSFSLATAIFRFSLFLHKKWKLLVVLCCI